MSQLIDTTLIKPWNHGERCPECGVINRQMKRHLVRVHGYRYTIESPNFPVKVAIKEADEQEHCPAGD